jgi:hypothetical protein
MAECPENSSEDAGFDAANPFVTVLKLRTLVTRRVSEGKIGSASSLAYASGFHFCWKTDNAQLQKRNSQAQYFPASTHERCKAVYQDAAADLALFENGNRPHPTLSRSKREREH